MSTQDVTVFQGNDIIIDVVVKDPSGTVVSLTGLQAASYGISKKPAGPTKLLTKTLGNGITVVNPTTGSLRIVLTAAETLLLKGSLFHELVLRDNAGKVGTVMTGSYTSTETMIDAP